MKQIKKRIVIEGGDGVGKSTIVKILKEKGYKNVFDRGLPTLATSYSCGQEFKEEPKPRDDEIYIFLDITIDEAMKRIKDRKCDESSYWHSEKSVCLYKQKYKEIAGKFGAHFVDANKPIKEVVECCENIISGKDKSRKVLDIDKLTEEEFQKFPLLVEGESKIVRICNEKLNLVVIKLKPTVYSYTHNRCGTVDDTDKLRSECTNLLLDPMRANGVLHSFWTVNEKWILSDRVFSPPPIEVVVKKYHVGTPKHRYYGMDKCKIRKGYFKDTKKNDEFLIENEKAYPKEFVRFDWRNPNWHPSTKKRLCDEVLCEPQADFFIDVKKAKKTALKAWNALQNHFNKCGLEIWDICFFIDETGEVLFSEVSQDCGRYRYIDEKSLDSLDKDVWRSGGSSKFVIQKWKKLNEILKKNKWKETHKTTFKLSDEYLKE